MDCVSPGRTLNTAEGFSFASAPMKRNAGPLREGVCSGNWM